MRQNCLRHAALITLLSALLPVTAAHAAAADADVCQAAISTIERSGVTPPQLLSAIARVESGRTVAGGRTVAWPWTLNVAGTGHFFDSAADAIAAVEASRAAGVHSIDVGCMQVNLVHHPGAFPSLQEAFEPKVNVAYAAKFLKQLHSETSSWPLAAAAYHSRTPERAAVYGQRVMRAWPLAASYGGATIFADALPLTTPAVVVDPYGIYTPEFARRLSADAATRVARGSKLRADVTPYTPRRGDTLAQRFPSQLRTPAARGGIRLAQSEVSRTGSVVRRR